MDTRLQRHQSNWRRIEELKPKNYEKMPSVRKLSDSTVYPPMKAHHSEVLFPCSTSVSGSSSEEKSSSSSTSSCRSEHSTSSSDSVIIFHFRVSNEYGHGSIFYMWRPFWVRVRIRHHEKNNNNKKSCCPCWCCPCRYYRAVFVLRGVTRHAT